MSQNWVVATENQLGAFLKARRARLQPADVGLPSPGNPRRTPGLRREEVAALAGISVDYCNRLEQGKETNPSPEVLDALARTLRLGPEERDHLHRLAGLAARRLEPVVRPSDHDISPGRLQLLDIVRPYPA